MPRMSGSSVRIVGVTMLLMVLWAVAVTAAVVMGAGTIAISGPGSAPVIDAAKRLTADHRGNFALAVIDHGRVAGTHFSSIDRPVNGDTLFQMASVSKWVTTWGVMRLVESGKLDLDVPVSRYLTRWQLPPTDYNNDQVTLRRLLSHTAGLTDDLGYCGFAPGQPVQTLEASLTATADACPLTDGRVRVGNAAGEWQYSGGGFTLIQLLIEEVSGQPFARYMDEAVLKPLGMTRSTFRTGAQASTNIAQFFDSDGTPALHYRYTAAAAGSLYASASDLTRFVQAHSPGPDGEPAGRGVLNPQSIQTMLAPQATLFGQPHWGLGVRLFARSPSGGVIVGHDGGNFPAVNTTVRIDMGTGDGMIALSTGGSGVASRLGTAWLNQRADPASLVRDDFNLLALLIEVRRVLWWIVGGALAIALGGSITLWRRRRHQ